MALYNNLHDYRFNDTEIDDIRGAAVYGTDDEKLGKVRDVIFDTSSGELRYVVIDSGGWLSSKRFIVPARHLMIRDEQDKDFRVNLTKAQVEKFPEYNDKHVDSETEWNDYEKRYKTAWADGPVMHREGSTHMVTPESVPGASGGDGMRHASPRRISHDMPRFGATSSSDSTEGVSLAGETDMEPAGSGGRKTIGRLIDEPIGGAGSASPAQADSDLREDAIGSENADYNPRVRTFEEWMRKYKEDIIEKRKKDRAA